MNLKKIDSVCIWSSDPDDLQKFYKETLELTLDKKLEFSNDYGYQFTVNGVFLFIDRHDGVAGRAKDPNRMMVGFGVDSVKKVYDELKMKGVKVIAEPFAAPEGGYYVTTIEDPEGNILQFFNDNP